MHAYKGPAISGRCKLPPRRLVGLLASQWRREGMARGTGRGRCAVDSGRIPRVISPRENLTPSSPLRRLLGTTVASSTTALLQMREGARGSRVRKREWETMQKESFHVIRTSGCSATNAKEEEDILEQCVADGVPSTVISRAQGPTGEQSSAGLRVAWCRVETTSSHFSYVNNQLATP